MEKSRKDCSKQPEKADLLMDDNEEEERNIYHVNRILNKGT